MPPVLLDTNVLVHASFSRSPLYGPASRLVDLGLKRRGLYCIAPQVLVEFAAVTTRRRRDETPLAPNELISTTELLLRSRTLKKIYPGRNTIMQAVREGAALGIFGSAWYDLFLAVTMREAGVKEIITENLSDFRRIPFVKPRSILEADNHHP